MASSTTPDYYAVLQVDPRAEQEVIQAAYRGLAKKYHPDVYTGADRHERMRAVNEAYNVLGDPATRVTYDQQRQREATHAAAAKTAAPPAGEKPTQDHTADQGSTAGQSHKEARTTGDTEQARTSQPFPPQSAPKRYSASASPFFTPFAPPPPPQAPPNIAPSGGGSPPLAFRPQLVPVLGGGLALLAFFLPWYSIQQTGLFLNVSTHAYTGFDLAGSSAGWVLVAFVMALALVGFGLFAAGASQRLQWWRVVAAALGLITVVWFMSQAASLLAGSALSSAPGSGCWLALGGFLLSLAEGLFSLARTRRVR